MISGLKVRNICSSSHLQCEIDRQCEQYLRSGIIQNLVANLS